MTMFDIGTELENASVAMRRAEDIWEIFLEDMEQDLEQMDGNDSWVQYMRKRFGRSKSLLEAAILQQGGQNKPEVNIKQTITGGGLRPSPCLQSKIFGQNRIFVWEHF